MTSDIMFTGMDRKYDELLDKFARARGHDEYRILGDTLRRWARDGEDVKPFCRLVTKEYPNRPALIWEMEKFFDQDEKLERRNKAEALKREKSMPICPRCKSQNIAKISYGFPYIDKKLEKDIADGRVVLGGCQYEPWFPRLRCNDCELKFSTSRKT